MSSNYWDENFLRHLDSDLEIVFEVGARYGDESIILSEIFSNSQIYSFECNPLTLNLCREKLKEYSNINFFDHALGEENTILPFYSYIDNNDGASSLLKRIDCEKTQKKTGDILVKKLSDFVKENKIQKIDLLCMDVQGYELNVLKGAEKFLTNIKYVIMEEPNPIINKQHLPEDMHSKYIGSPTPNQIKDFMNNNGFFEIDRGIENLIEHNVMYKNILVGDLL